MNTRYWTEVNRTLCAKIISELHYEELLSPQKTALGWQLDGATQQWRFHANTTLWGMLEVDPKSICRADGAKVEAVALVLDLRQSLGMTDINLANFLEELQQTLYSDMVRLEQLENLTATDLVNMGEAQRQRYLDAHPKAVANKGRLGWGTDDLHRYAPESGNAFALRWLAVRKTCCQAGVAQGLDYQALLTQVLGQAEYQKLVAKLSGSVDDFHLLAVHPWQHQRFLSSQFATLFASGDLVDLGESGPQWLAQQSIRTLSASDPGVPFDAKTALTILNTSCYRGIPGKFIVQGPQLSAWLAKLAASDATLKRQGLYVQQEVAGFFCEQPYQTQIAKGPYRYHEQLGCIWRERAESVIGDHCRPITMAALMQTDAEGMPLIQALVERSGISPAQWLTQMFEHVVVPLYHLMCQYGVGLVAHGQNITLVLENDAPVGCTIKDFHGDLRLVDQEFVELESLDDDIRHTLTKLPAEHLVHDLLTGHFVTVLRFISPKVTGMGVSELSFYRLLRQVIEDYQQQHPELRHRFKQFDLLSPTIAKVCVNRVRFKIGYGDSDERPLPDIGEPIANPLMM